MLPHIDLATTPNAKRLYNEDSSKTSMYLTTLNFANMEIKTHQVKYMLADYGV